MIRYEKLAKHLQHLCCTYGNTYETLTYRLTASRKIAKGNSYKLTYKNHKSSGQVHCSEDAIDGSGVWNVAFLCKLVYSDNLRYGMSVHKHLMTVVINLHKCFITFRKCFISVS